MCTQRGYYPSTPDKPSQDAQCVHIDFGGNPNHHFFGVFDGHGEHGTQCAEFIRDEVRCPPSIRPPCRSSPRPPSEPPPRPTRFSRPPPSTPALCPLPSSQVPKLLLSDPDYAQAPHIALYNAFMHANENMHRSRVEDTMSGTTGIVVLIRGSKIFVANVGDSRAIISERSLDARSEVSHDLSSDQTPYRQDELKRVRAAGAVVLTLDQLEGIKNPSIDCWTNEYADDGDPPRIW